MDNLSVEHAPRKEPLISKTPISNSMNTFPEKISKGHASRHEPNDLSAGHASRQEPLISDASVPNAMNILPAIVSDGHGTSPVDQDQNIIL